MGSLPSVFGEARVSGADIYIVRGGEEALQRLYLSQRARAEAEGEEKKNVKKALRRR